jgi:hypothetical protein
LPSDVFNMAQFRLIAFANCCPGVKPIIGGNFCRSTTDPDCGDCCS